MEAVEESTGNERWPCTRRGLDIPEVSKECLKSSKNLLPIGLLTWYNIAIGHKELDKRRRDTKGLKDNIKEARVAKIGKAYVVSHVYGGDFLPDGV
jgi:hypothetical protein